MSGPVHTPPARRSRVPRILSIIWLVVFALVAIPTVFLLVRYLSQPADQRVPAAGGDVTISRPGDYAVYAESTRGSPGNWPGIVSITTPSGAPANAVAPGFSENYNYNSRVATRIATLTASEPGTYRIVGDDRGTIAGDELVVSSRTVGAIFGVIAGSVATGGLLLVGVLGGLGVLAVRRRRVTSPPPFAAVPGAYGPPPAGLGGAPAPPVANRPAPPVPNRSSWSSSEEPTVTVHRDDGAPGGRS